MKGKSLNDKKKVQSDFLKRVERLCGEDCAIGMNTVINWHFTIHDKLPDYVLKSHYRSLSKEVRKPVKYSNKAK